MASYDLTKSVSYPDLVTLRNPIATARYGLSINQQKAFLEVCAYFKANPSDRYMRLYVREFLQTIGVKTNSLTDLVEDIRGMLGISINIPKTQKRGEIRFLEAKIFASAEFQIDAKGIGYIEIEVSEKLKPYLIEVLNGDFFSFKLPNTRVLKSNYSIKIYMLLKSHKRFKKLDIGYPELRDILNIEPHEYKLFGDFKRRVLDRAKDEIGEKTDMEFTYALIRAIPNNKNSEVARVVFHIKSAGEELTTSPQLELPTSTVDTDSEAYNLIRQIDPYVTRVEADEFIGNLGLDQERLLDILVYALEEKKRGIVIRSLFAYIVKGSKTPSMGLGAYKRYQDKAEAEKSQQKAQNDHAEIERAMNKEYDDYKQRGIYDLGVNAPIERKNQFFTKLLSDIADNSALKKLYFTEEGNLIQDQARAGLGYEILTETMSEDQLFIKYMLEVKKRVVYRDKGFWTYSEMPKF